MVISEEMIEAGRLAWNKMESYFSEKAEFFDPQDNEFKSFYTQLVTHLLEEETSE